MSENQRTPIQVKRELKARMKELRPFIPRGEPHRIATELNLSDSFVYEIIAGRRWDLDVIEALLDVGETNLQRAIKAEQRLGKILEKGKAVQ